MAISLAKVTEYVASILNAADWKVVTDGVTNGTTTLTSATAAFVTADKGKTISITGAGAAGVTLLTTISSVTNATTVVLTDAATSTATAHTVSVGGRSSDPRHTEPQIIEAILQKDLDVCTEILQTPNHPGRATFTETVGAVVSGALVPAHTGVLGRVEIQFTTGSTWREGLEAPFHKVIRWSRNIASVYATTDVREGFYAFDRGHLHYTGASARVSYVLLTKTTAPQAPVEYTNVVAVNAAAELFATEGDDLNAAQALGQVGLAGYLRVARPETK